MTMAPDRGNAASTQNTSRSWEALIPPLSQWILDAVSSMGFSNMTPVQASTIPLFMGYKDVVVEAVTGSGKTLAFLIPVVEKLLGMETQTQKHHVCSIIISPTRELAVQIHQVLISLLKFHGPSAIATRQFTSTEDGDPEQIETLSEAYHTSVPKIVPQLLVGGSGSPAQDLSRFLKTSPNLLISTPGRLVDILSSPYVHCPQSSFEVLVLDEADRLLDLGFKDDLAKILARLPKQRRTGLFSASVSEAVDQIIRVGLRNPVRIAVKVRGASGELDKRTPASLQMKYHITAPTHKFPALSTLLKSLNPRPQKSIVYLSTCAAVDYLQSLLPSILPSDVTLIPLHGKHPPAVRTKNFNHFTNSAMPTLLLTTDVAARGLDIPSVDLIVQIDPPTDPKVFLHRCGRTGRAGRRGLAVVFLQSGREEDYISFLSVRKTPIEPLLEPSIGISPDLATQTTSTFRELVLKDRALHDKAQKAFVSWVRAYSKHEASSIFRVKDLNWTELAEAWGLLKMPKMPELKASNWDCESWKSPEVDWEAYAYRDKAREKARIQKLESVETEPGGGLAERIPRDSRKRGSVGAWSATLSRKASREVRREKKRARRQFERQSTMTEHEKTELKMTEQMVALVRQQQERRVVQMDADEFDGFD